MSVISSSLAPALHLKRFLGLELFNLMSTSSVGEILFELTFVWQPCVTLSLCKYFKWCNFDCERWTMILKIECIKLLKQLIKCFQIKTKQTAIATNSASYLRYNEDYFMRESKIRTLLKKIWFMLKKRSSVLQNGFWQNLGLRHCKMACYLDRQPLDIISCPKHRILYNVHNLWRLDSQ